MATERPSNQDRLRSLAVKRQPPAAVKRRRWMQQRGETAAWTEEATDELPASEGEEAMDEMPANEGKQAKNR